MRSLKTDAGFTLLEVLVVTCVIGIIAAVAAVTFIGALDRARQRGTMGDMRTVCNALAAYAVDHDRLPADGGGLASLRTVMVPYATQVWPVFDHWGHGIMYELDSASLDYSLISYGKDGIDGVDYAPSQAFDYDGDLVIFNGVFVSAP